VTSNQESEGTATRKSKRPVSLAEDASPRGSLATAVSVAAFALLLIFVAVAPFPYGGILPGGNLEIEVFAFIIAALAFLSRPRGTRLGALQIPIYSLLFIAALGAFQLLPLSRDLLRRVSPVSLQTHDSASRILGLYGRPGTTPVISVAPDETRGTILLTLAFAALLMASALVVHTRARRRQLAIVLFATSIGQIVYAATIAGDTDRIHGAFVNPNHFAGYLEIALTFAFGTIWTELLMGRERVAGIRDRGERLEKRAVPLILRSVLWGVIATGIALTRSRGGIVAAGVATFALVGMASLHRSRGPRRKRAAIGAAVAVTLGLGLVVLTTGSAPFLRFLSSDPRDVGTDERVTIWRTSFQAWRVFPDVGSGLGAFREAFRRRQPADLHELVEQAHNDFLQLLVTGGWVGATLGAILFLSMLTLLARAWRRQKHREESAFILAGFGALLALTLHGAVDFNMSVPAIPATLAVMGGAAWGARAKDR
jgi:putative inorganic carbon (HCO3(-)) transporter